MSGSLSPNLDSTYLRALFDAIPVPTLIVDADMRIHDHNTAAVHLIGPQKELVLLQRSGEAMRCLQAEPKGCGQGEACKDCVVRLSVRQALDGGKTYRKTHKMEVRGPEKVRSLEYLVTATRLPGAGDFRALLILEDITELQSLRGLIPICAQCKKVRDDQQYWHTVESYLRTQMNCTLTHGLCPACFAEQMKLIGAHKSSTV